MSRHRLDKINVIDVECTCWDDQIAGPQPFSEIIEIGNCQVDTRTLEVVWGEAILVRPTASAVSEFCTTLTGHTEDELMMQGISFEDACLKLRKDLKTERFLWASWGDYDRGMFQEQCKREGIRYPFGPTHFNIKALYALWLGLRSQLSVSQALADRGWEFEGRPHNGQDDTNNITRLLVWLLKRR